MKILRWAILAGMVAAAYCPAQTLTLPGGGTISGTPGETVGWGYSITNNSSTDWLQPENLISDSFPSDLEPNAIFDYPEIAPLQTVTELFSTSVLNGACVSLDCGVFEVVIPITAVAPATVTGTFTIQAEYFADSAESIDDGPASSLSADYTLNVVSASTATPEPGTITMLVTGLALVFVRKR
jgi:hypothetical protein